MTQSRQRGFTGRVLVVTAGVIHKNQSTDILCAAVRQVARGEAWLEQNYLSSLFRITDRTSSSPKAR